jgi:hypothetical protein
MLRLLSDEDFHGGIVRGLVHKQVDFDVVRVQDVGLREQPDDVILQWAARDHRVLLTHDRNTIPALVKQMLAANEAVAGVMIVSQQVKIGVAVEDILIAAHCGNPDEWPDRTLYLPL